MQDPCSYPSGLASGGVALRTREAVLVCEAAGFDYVLVETVGVGQSETAVANMTDLFLLLLLPAAGDELQGIKRGIVELADIILINKADGELQNAAQITTADYRHALRLSHPRSANWTVPVQTCSAFDAQQILDVWSIIQRYFQGMEASGELYQRRAQQALGWLWTDTNAELMQLLKSDEHVKRLIPELQQQIESGSLFPSNAARQLIQAFVKTPNLPA